MKTKKRILIGIIMAILITLILSGCGAAKENEEDKENETQNALDKTATQAEMQAIEIFNSKFTGYIGTQTASAVKALMTQVTSNNDNYEEHQIDVYEEKRKSTPKDIQSTVKSSEQYMVELNYNNIGYIDKITITEL